MLEAIGTLNLAVALHFLAQLGAAIRVLARPDRPPAVRAGWLVLIFSVPVAGIILYLLVGETRLNFRIARRQRKTLDTLPPPRETAPVAIPDGWRPSFARAASVNGYTISHAMQPRLLVPAEAQIAALLADIEAARETIHLISYIWLDDPVGRALAQALERAAKRGIKVCVLVDGLGARKFIRSPVWAAMRAAGVQTGVAFPFHWPLFKLATSRIDLRNHRKLAVIDARVAYIGSRNIAAPEFEIKARFAPWTDIMLRLEGPVVAQHAHIFASDWLTHTGQALASENAPPTPDLPDTPAICFASGPMLDTRAIPDVFGAAIGAANTSLTLSTPYFVPGEGLDAALRAAARRGVRVRLIVPRRNDSRFVGFASRSYYPALIAAGVEIFEHGPGILHAKTLLADDQALILGSANLDRRSYELNYEACILMSDPVLARDLAAAQEMWIGQSIHVDRQSLARWSVLRRLMNNLISILAPVL
ncbi:MAG: PLDc N-terminal domain-containing protein [Rhodobacteraceae bacterium]|nr:PLDc N-terminal domain-containing protein [Paracoccaceae bacterium]